MMTPKKKKSVYVLACVSVLLSLIHIYPAKLSHKTDLASIGIRFISRRRLLHGNREYQTTGYCLKKKPVPAGKPLALKNLPIRLI